MNDMTTENIKKHYTGFSVKQKDRFWMNSRILFNLEILAMELRGPYKYIVDTNVLIRLERYIVKREITEGTLAIITFLQYLVANNAELSIVVCPSVFYEFIGQNKVEDRVQHWEHLKTVYQTFYRTTGIRLLTEGIETFEIAQEKCALIQKDQEIIRQNIAQICANNYNVKLVKPHSELIERISFPRKDGLLEIPPIAAAETLCPVIKFEYYDYALVKGFFMHHIAHIISNNPNNDQQVISKYSQFADLSLKEILCINSERNVVTGLADIEILGLCNIQQQYQSQSNGTYYPASIPFTLDENLYKGLCEFSKPMYGTKRLSGDMSAEERRMEIERFNEQYKTSAEADKRKGKCIEIQLKYIEHLKELLKP